MTQEEDVALIRSGYEAYARRDFAAVFELLAPDIEIVQTPLLPWGGTYQGLAEAQTFFRKLAELTDATPEPTAYIPAGDDVAVVGRLRGTARATGAAFDLDIVHLWTLRDGKAVRFAAYLDTPAMLRALQGE